MPSCMERLAGFISLAKSKKVTEYKKAIKSLLEFFDDNSEDAFRQITEFSRDPSKADRYDTYNWNDIFATVHELFVIEIHRLSKLSGNSGKLDRERITKLVYYTTEKANYCLKPKCVVRSTLQILQIEDANVYSEFFEIYLSILRKYVLQERSQRILIDPKYWQELIRACISILENVIPHVDYAKLVETVELIVRHGCSLSILLSESRSLLPTIAKLLEDYETYNIISTDVLFKLTFTVCKKIATDSRFLLCRFSEKMPLSLINLKGPEEKYKLYLLLVLVHHPNGSSLDDDVSFAYDEDKWKAILSLLSKMIINDIKPSKLSKNFIDLACEVFRQRILTKLPNSTQFETFHESLYIQPNKKRRVSDESEKLIDLVNYRDHERAWPIIQIATALYRKYPDCLKFDEYSEFLEVTIKLMNQASKNFSIMENLCELAIVFINIGRQFENNDSRILWDKMWDVVLRYLSMSHNESIVKGYILVQNLIIDGRISNPNSLLKLYFSRSIQWSNYSIETLKIFCENLVLPLDIEGCDMNKSQSNHSLKLHLLQWTLDSLTKRLPSPLNMDDFSRMLIGFTLKSWYKPQVTENHLCYKYNFNLEDNIHDSVESITSKDIERCYLSLRLKIGLPFDQNHDSNIVVPLNEYNFDNPHVTDDLEYLINNLLQIVQMNERENLNSFITKTVLIARVISDLKAMKMIPCYFDEFCLVNGLRNCISKIVDQIQRLDWFRNIRYTLEITKALILLYQTKYDKDVSDIILDKTSIPVLKKIYEISKIKSDEFESDTKTTQCKLNSVIVLAWYCSMSKGTEISDNQIIIMSTLLKLKKYSLLVDADVTCVMTILDIIVNVPLEMVTDEYVELLMEFIEQLFDQWQRDDNVNRSLLQMIPIIFKKLIFIRNADKIHNVLMMCRHYHNEIIKGRFGESTQLSLVNCLTDIVKHRAFHDSEVKVLDHKIFVSFVNSPYYLVRLESLRYIYSIFSMKEIDYDWKNKFFKEMEDQIDEFFILHGELSPEEVKEERLLRSISVMQILATVICSKSIFQSPALFTLMRVALDKKIDANIVAEILKVINTANSPSKSIVSNLNILEENLNYILTSWIQIKDLNVFPYSLLSCSSEMDFYNRYISIIFPVLIREGKTQEAQNLCEKLNITFEQVFRSSCSNIIPWTLTNERKETLEQLKNGERPFETINDFPSLVKDKLQQIIVQIVQRLVDLNHFYATFATTINLPRSDPPHYKIEEVDQCFEHLVNVFCHDTRRTVFYFLMKRKPKVIQNILLILVCNIYAERISEYRAKAFHQYVYFCSKIVIELQDSYCDYVSTYFIKDIGYTLINLIKADDSFIAKLACTYLHTFFKSILPKRSEEVANILDLCIKTLTPLVGSPDDSSTAKEILIFLLDEQRPNLINAIEKLCTLPTFISSRDDSDADSQLLRENLRHFLRTSDDKNCSSIASLVNLKRQLESKRSQLQELYEELESTQGLAEHCKASLLHQLIYRLIKLTNSVDTKIGLEAAKCLGVLGPADLTTLILHPQETQGRESVNKADLLTFKVCQMLADLVLSPDIELRKVSSDVLYLVLESPWGARINSSEAYDSRENSQFLEKFLQPFKKKESASSSANLQVDITELEQVFNPENPLWSEKSNEPYNAWLAEITSAVARCLSGFYSRNLTPVFALDVRFCEITLPRLVALIVHANSNFAANVCHCVNRFFDHHFSQQDVTVEPTLTLASLSGGQKRMQRCKARDAIRCMLEVVNHMRIQTREQVQLDFDYLPIALAAQFCSAYFSSVLYAELWCISNLHNPKDFDSLPVIDQIYDQDARQGKIVQDILKEAYMKIGDSDSMHGCGSSHLHNRTSRIPYYTNFHKLDKLILAHDVELSVSGGSSSRGMIAALKESSLHHLSKRMLSSIPMEVDTMDDLCYDSLWRLSDWNQVTNLRSNSSKKTNDFSTYHYEALKSLHENDNSSLKNSLEQAHLCIIKELSSISLESCKAVYPKLSQLQMLREIEELHSKYPDDYKILLADWEKQKYVCNNNFQYIEPILSQRAVMFKIRDPIKSSSVIHDAFVDVQLDTAQLAQEQGYLNVAARALETLLIQSDLNEEAENRLLYYEARLAWLRKDEDLARFNLRTLIKKNSIKPNLLARALRVYGNWIAESKSENPQAIISKYYEKAIITYLSMTSLSPTDLSDGCKARAALAQFAHEQYLVISEYMRSPQFESLKECLDYTRNVVPKVREIVAIKDEDVQRAVKLNTRQTSNDSIELENIQKDRAMYLTLAIKNYLVTLQDSDEHDFLIFRLVSLWLDNNNMHDEEVNHIFECQLNLVPSYKFIALVPQLAPHMSNNDEDAFSKKIGHVLERCATQHPHHTLPVLLALKNLYNDSKFCNKSVKKLEPRVLGAQQLIQKLLSSDIRPVIQEMDRLSDALVELAYTDDKKKVSVGSCPIPPNLRLNDIKNFQHSLLPTLNINVQKNGNYSSIISIRKYESSYGNVGGINAPKKIVCYGTDGIRRPQLVKGKDDLRQDAVMQQVFTVMNSLLKSNKDAKQRKLHIRTYKVVPLTQRSGVLQWCENTLPLSIILTGDGSKENLGLHRKYHPSDYTPHECRRRINTNNNPHQSLNIFMECCNNLRPAFHYFFTENYLSPETWFERRLTYTRSVATTSIIGYILGLGDRHVSNILIDKATAEVIHIDFGIAFEQGKVLPTPETVPFRLTRDIEAAMGVSGVEGTMRRCCEETMIVLRNQREIIVTLLRVLLYDPLYSWAITPAKAATYQSEHSSRSSENKESNSPGPITETNKLAERALLRVQQKLQGIEEGVASSIAGQVERLIQQARDPTNLCRLFQGWQAYL